MQITALKPHPSLTWYYAHSAAALGLRSSPPSQTPPPPSPSPLTPTQQQLAAARRQITIRAALHQLSPQLQAALETVYTPRSTHASAQMHHEHGIAAPLVIAASRAARPTPADAAAIHALVVAAHAAFDIAFGPARTGPQRRRQRVERWISKEGLE